MMSTALPGATTASPLLTEAAFKNRPDDTPFKQQRIPSWQPVMSPRCAIGSLGIVAVIFIVIGSVIVASSDKTQVLEFQYDQDQYCPYSSRNIPSYTSDRYSTLNSSIGQYWACSAVTITFTVTKTLPAPVQIYYKIQNMNQNHRTYAKSVNYLQLAGQSISPSDASDCSPLLRANERMPLSDNPYVVMKLDSQNTGVFDASQAIYSPCGLIAWSQFNDSFVLKQNGNLICETSNYRADGSPTPPSGSCTKNGIAWSTDPGYRYNAPVMSNGTILTSAGWPVVDSNTSTTSTYSTGWGFFASRGWYSGEPGHRVPDPLDEDLMVWMRLGLLADFQKLHRIINVDLTPGTYTIDVFQRYDVSAFGGKKSIVLTTSNWIGGQNYWLGGLYLAVGCVAAILALGFLVKYLTTPQILSF